ncbi:uncharacterized protein LOC107273617 [Cephus cinctus]|uniref:Uncharacterized protein LOC107273617 n=1 Tax=Cephus cinctus TaxID=211228 RepID=A0AAJ7CCK8_CEPCN|nr:uncharacterized protein LOC107273617 [Cephus cinctus]
MKMWKFMTRGIRETLERRTNCRTNVYSQSSPNNNEIQVKNRPECSGKFHAPNLTSCKDNNICGSTKTAGAKDEKHDSKWNPRHTWREAIGWSSMLAVGWVVCQTLCLRRRIFEADQKCTWRQKILFGQEARISHLLLKATNLHPYYVLPVTNCIGQSNDNSGSNAVEQEWTANKPYGPITIEEAFQEAGDEFTRTHRLVMGEFELRFGIKAIEEKRYKDAIKHFSTGATLSSPGSTFNLGLCYEMGIGTLVDNLKAAKYYHDAAEQGHADAMYNLGVFHAQGRGGLPIDTNMARMLFTKAAGLGQVQAQEALSLEKNIKKNNLKDNSVLRMKANPFQAKRISKDDNTKDSMFVKMVEYENDIATNLDAETVSNKSYSDHIIKQGQNPTDIFLGFLGLHEPNPVPITVGCNNKNMSY